MSILQKRRLQFFLLYAILYIINGHQQYFISQDNTIKLQNYRYNSSLNPNNQIIIFHKIILFDHLSNIETILLNKNGKLLFMNKKLQLQSQYNIGQNKQTLSKAYLNDIKTSLFCLNQNKKAAYYFNLITKSTFKHTLEYKTLYIFHFQNPKSTTFLIINSDTISAYLYNHTSLKLISNQIVSNVQYNSLSYTINCTHSLSVSYELKLYCFNNQNYTMRFIFTLSPNSDQMIKLISKSIFFFKNKKQIINLFYLQNILFIQDNQLAITSLSLNQGNSLITFNFTFLKSTVLNLFYFNQSYYLISNLQFIQMWYNTTNLVFNKLSYSNMSFYNTTYSNMNIVFGTARHRINVIYQIGTDVMFPVYVCSEGYQYDEETNQCVIKQCQIIGCQQCNLNQYSCTYCENAQYFIQSNYSTCKYQCLIDKCITCINSSYCYQCQHDYYFSTYTQLCEKVFKPYTHEHLNQIDKKYNQIATNSKTKSLQISLRNINMLKTFRSQLGFLSPIFALFDDYWYYIYHRNQMKNLQIIPIFLYSIYETNLDRHALNFVQIKQLQANLSYVKSQVSKYYSFYSDQMVIDLDKQATFFSYNLRLLILQGITIILIFIIANACRSILSIFKEQNKPKVNNKYDLYDNNKFNKQNNYDFEDKLSKQLQQTQQQNHKNEQKLSQSQKKSNIFKHFNKFLKQTFNFPRFFALIFQGNILFISFQAGIQFSIFFALDYGAKINLLFVIIAQFSILFFAFGFYLITRKKKKNIDDNEYYFNIYLHKALLIGFKNFMLGIIHSSFLPSNSYQLILIILIKILILLLLCTFSLYLLQHKLLKIFTITYFLSSISIDILLILSKTQFLKQFQQQYLSEYKFILYLQIFCVGLLIFSVICNFIIGIIVDLVNLRFNHKNNKRCKYAIMEKSKKYMMKLKNQQGYNAGQNQNNKNKKHSQNNKNNQQYQDLSDSQKQPYSNSKDQQIIFDEDEEQFQSQNSEEEYQQNQISHQKQQIKKQSKKINNSKQTQKKQIKQIKNKKNKKQKKQKKQKIAQNLYQFPISFQNHHNPIHQQQNNNDYPYQTNNNDNKNQKNNKKIKKQIVQINNQNYRIHQDLINQKIKNKQVKTKLNIKIQIMVKMLNFKLFINELNSQLLIFNFIYYLIN